MIIVSSCLVGDPCRYDGTSVPNDLAMKLAKKSQICRVCPEVLGGLSTPREPSEIIEFNPELKQISDVCVMSKTGIDVTSEFYEGALKTLEIAKENQAVHVILKSKSPSCGMGQRYDGSFSGKLIDGNGMTAQLLTNNGFKVYNSDTVSYEKVFVYDFLDTLNIDYSKVEHKPVFTVEEAKALDTKIPGAHCKNLFLRDKRKKNYYLVIAPEDKNINLKTFGNEHELGSLSFASEKDLEEILGVTKGSLGFFSLLNDRDKNVQLYISNDFKASKKISFHPNKNDETLIFNYDELEKMTDVLGYNIHKF